jgi:hypothetical protein
VLRGISPPKMVTLYGRSHQLGARCFASVSSAARLEGIISLFAAIEGTRRHGDALTRQVRILFEQQLGLSEERKAKTNALRSEGAMSMGPNSNRWQRRSTGM